MSTQVNLATLECQLSVKQMSFIEHERREQGVLFQRLIIVGCIANIVLSREGYATCLSLRSLVARATEVFFISRAHNGRAAC